MFHKRYHRQIPELNTTSTADISFMLLIFFLVTSSMDTEKGLMRQMASPPVAEEQPLDISKEHVMRITLDADSKIACDGKTVTLEQLADEVRAMVSVDRTGHVLAIQTERQSTYEAYFNMQNTIAAAYRALREDYAWHRFHSHYSSLGTDERTLVNEYIPMRISESPVTEGGEP